jgi:hypothetical protein
MFQPQGVCAVWPDSKLAPLNLPDLAAVQNVAFGPELPPWRMAVAAAFRGMLLKNSPFGWHCALGSFGPAELSRLLGFCGRWIGGDFDADPTDVIISDLRQMLGAAGRVVDRGFAAPAS